MVSLTLALFALYSSLTIATPIHQATSDTSTDMDDVISNGKACASNALIFARNTFENGNLGTWVGIPLKNDVLKTFKGDIHVQGVNPSDYPASLNGYIGYFKDSGKWESCHDACAKTLYRYSRRCPHTNLFVSGWGHGAICAQKCVSRLQTGSRALKQTKGLVVFGSPNSLLDNPLPIRQGVPYKEYCNTDATDADQMCTESATTFQTPAFFTDFINQLTSSLGSLGDLARNDFQKKAAEGLSMQLSTSFFAEEWFFWRDLWAGKARRWAMRKPHFEYESKGYVAQAAAWMRQQV